jgi:MATE family multidrug resistance protein
MLFVKPEDVFFRNQSGKGIYRRKARLQLVRYFLERKAITLMHFIFPNSSLPSTFVYRIFANFALSYKTIMKQSSNIRHGHYTALLNLGVPIIIGQIGTIVLNFADTLMIGHHSTVELAAASFINTLLVLVIIFALGFSYGLTPVVGNLVGRGETGKIGGVMRTAMAANTMLAALMLAVVAALYVCLDRLGQPEELIPLMRPYLLVNIISLPFVCWQNTFKQFYDAIGDTTTPMYVLIGGNVLNISGNYMLIYGALGFPEMGLLGAGISTMASRIIMCAVFAVLFFRARRYRIYGDGFRRSGFDGAVFRRLNALGWPIALQMGMETAAFSLTAIFVGWMGMVSLAAHQIMLTVSQLFFMVYYGLAAAVSVRVSYFHGQGDTPAIRATTSAGFRMILLVASVVAVPIFLLRGTVSLWFNDSAEVCLLVSHTIIPLILYQFGDGLQCTFANALRGMSCVRPMMYAAFFSYFVVSLPLSWWLGIRMGYGLVGLWYAFPVCLTCAGVLYYLIYRREVRGIEG